MARDRANIRTDMWGSGEWRKLSTGAQWLYMHLLTSPNLSYVGVADWRPGRIAAKVEDAPVDVIRERADELSQGRFVYSDDATEEIMVRSFLRHDGLLMNPNLWRSIGNDFADAASETIRGIISHEANRLRREHPDGFTTSKGGIVNPWESKHLATLLDTPPFTPWYTPIQTPSSEGGGTGCPTTTATTTATPLLKEGGALSAPSPFCKRHPDGTDKPCRGCKVAWVEYEKWAADDGPVTHTHRWLTDGTCIGCTEMQEVT